MSSEHEIPTIEEIEVAEAADELPTAGADDDKEARAQLAQKADEAWGTGDAAGQAWEAPGASSDAWVPTINPWALHQSDEIADWLRRKAEDVADDLAKMPERMKAAVNKAPETREKLRHVENHYTASLQRQLAHIDRLRAMTGDTTLHQHRGPHVSDSANGNAKGHELAGLMSQQKAADYLQMSLRTLQKMRAANDGPSYIPMRGRIFYRIDDLRAYVDRIRIDTVA